jgi:hypothetical protein
LHQPAEIFARVHIQQYCNIEPAKAFDVLRRSRTSHPLLSKQGRSLLKILSPILTCIISPAEARPLQHHRFFCRKRVLLNLPELPSSSTDHVLNPERLGVNGRSLPSTTLTNAGFNFMEFTALHHLTPPGPFNSTAECL